METVNDRLGRPKGLFWAAAPFFDFLTAPHRRRTHRASGTRALSLETPYFIRSPPVTHESAGLLISDLDAEPVRVLNHRADHGVLDSIV